MNVKPLAKFVRLSHSLSSKRPAIHDSFIIRVATPGVRRSNTIERGATSIDSRRNECQKCRQCWRVARVSSSLPLSIFKCHLSTELFLQEATLQLHPSRLTAKNLTARTLNASLHYLVKCKCHETTDNLIIIIIIIIIRAFVRRTMSASELNLRRLKQMSRSV